MPEMRGRASVCNRCEKPIVGLVYVDPKGGYFKKPEGTPDFLPRMAKVTYCLECNNEVHGRKAPVQKQQSNQPSAQTLGSKMLEKLAWKVVETIRADRKRKWQVWDLITMLKQIASQKDLRTTCNWLKKQGYIKRKDGALIITKAYGKAYPSKP